MRISIHGTDAGNAVLSALIIIMILSSVFLTLVTRITAAKRYTHEFKSGVIREIDQFNREVLYRYDLH